MQSIPRNNFGGQLGEALGSGINQLAQFKLADLTKKYEQQKERSDFTKTWEPILGKSQAHFLSNLAPEERRNILNNFGNFQELFQQQGQQQNGLGMLSQQNDQQQFDQQQQDPYQHLLQAARQFNGSIGQQQNALGSLFQQQPQQQFGQQKHQQVLPGQLQDQQQGKKFVPDKTNLIQGLFETPEQRAKKEKVEFENKKFDYKQKSDAFKETKAERKEILDQAKSAKDALARLDRMQELSEKGKLDSPLYVELLKKTGFDIPALLTPDSNEFRKLEVDFLRDAKNIFGARVTNYEAAQFLKSIPSLSQNKEGRARVIRNLKIMNEGKLVRAETLKDILRENKGNPPLDIAEQVEDRAAPKIDKLLQEFRYGTQNKSGKFFNDLPPAAQYNGKKIRDKESGKILKSNGQEWLLTE